MRILVCGGRDYTNWDFFCKKLRTCSPLFNDILTEYEHGNGVEPVPVIIQGGASGVDQMARLYAECYFLEVEEYPAEWNTYGKAAGPIRNQRMLEEGKPDFVVAFPGGTGTADMVRRAKREGVPVIEVKE